MKQEEFKQYRRKQIAELRPYEIGEILDRKVSISQADSENGSPKIGDMIARNPTNHNDQWLVAKLYFDDNFEINHLLSKQKPSVSEEEINNLNPYSMSGNAKLWKEGFKAGLTYSPQVVQSEVSGLNAIFDGYVKEFLKNPPIKNSDLNEIYVEEVIDGLRDEVLKFISSNTLTPPDAEKEAVMCSCKEQKQVNYNECCGDNCINIKNIEH